MPIRPIASVLETKVEEFWKIQEISFQISTRTTTFGGKMAEKNEVKVAYPPYKTSPYRAWLRLNAP